jgi:C-terminal processing protease CtpA/Prc
MKTVLLHILKNAISITLLAAIAYSQQITKLDRENAQTMLQAVANEVRKHYYDPKFHGVDWDATVAQAKQKIEKATSLGMALSSIAAATATLDDSHTYFLPPERYYRYGYGIKYQIVGERCFVTQVRPRSDAETKGVKIGDEILTINGNKPTRDTLWTIQYVLGALRPQPSLLLGLQNPTGAQRQVEVMTKFHEKKLLTKLTWENGATDFWDIVRDRETQNHLMRARTAEFGDPLLILKIPEFYFTPIEMGDMIGKARKHQSLIIDLRGNPGGSVDNLEYLVGHMFEKDVKIADRVGRKDLKPLVGKGTRDLFTGKVIVLVDSGSGSASELFARVMQIEKRSVVFGDRTSGSVMESRHYEEQVGTNEAASFFAVSVTDADLIMTDGKSLEHVGVTPDRVLLPSPGALANGRDPVLAAAAAELGVKISSEDAGKLFPYEWPPED